MEQLLGIAIRSEIKAAENYEKAVHKTSIFLLKEKFIFLEKEEVGHRQLLERLYAMKFPGKKIDIPKNIKKPFKEFDVTDDMQLSEILTNAIDNERAASDFYKELEMKLETKDMKAMARYLASMEESHYYLLKSELEIVHNFELYDQIHHMMHVGP